jgi:hypothetical protein
LNIHWNIIYTESYICTERVEKRNRNRNRKIDRHKEKKRRWRKEKKRERTAQPISSAPQESGLTLGLLLPLKQFD